MARPRIVVIGGGPAGLMAAGQAAAAGADTLLLEKMYRPARKLGITGKGRCNLTNAAPLSEFIEHFGRTGRFLRQAFSSFFSPDLIEFFESLGLPLVTERGGRVFPASGSAPAVVRVLVKWAEQADVKIQCSSPVDRLVTDKEQIPGVVVQGRKIPCGAVILATGGASYPATGSTGDGYRLVESVGHRVVPVRPALVPLITSGNAAGRMAGLDLRNVGVKLLIDGKKSASEFGELSFTSFGVTGPAILTLSGRAVDALQDQQQVALAIDLKPALDEKKLDARLLRDFAARSREPFNVLLRGLLPSEIVPVCLESTGISPAQTASNLTAKQRRRLRTWLKDFRLEVTGHRPFSEAIITAGGVDTREVDSRTMGSRRVKGLFIVGEVLDIQADTGGFNLQAAFSTGWLAGQAAAQGH